MEHILNKYLQEYFRCDTAPDVLMELLQYRPDVLEGFRDVYVALKKVRREKSSLCNSSDLELGTSSSDLEYLTRSTYALPIPAASNPKVF